LRCRHAAIYPWWNDDGGRAFHNNFWANIEMNLQTGHLEEHENRLPTPESVYKMTDPDWTVQALKDDLALNMMMFARGNVSDLDMNSVRNLAKHLGFESTELAKAQPSREVIDQLLNRYAFAATKVILTKAKEFADREQQETSRRAVRSITRHETLGRGQAALRPNDRRFSPRKGVSLLRHESRPCGRL
jgi:hypothetical protein